MTSSSRLEAAATGDGWPLYALGDWLVRPTVLLRRTRRKAQARVFLLMPPPGFTGQARLGVIDGRSREEYFASWHGGRHGGAPEEVVGALDRCYAALLDAPPAPCWPIGFAARLARPQGSVRVDLLLEVKSDGAIPAGRPSGANEAGWVRLGGTFELPPARAVVARIYVLPLVAAPRGPAGDDALAGALRGARRDEDLRLAVAADRAPWILEHGMAAGARDLVARGRLELLWTPTTDPDALRRLELPFPARAAWLPHDADIARPLPAIRGILRLPGPGTLCQGGALHPPAGRARRATDAWGDFTAYEADWLVCGDAFAEKLTPYAQVLCDHAARAAGLACLPVCLAHAREVDLLHRGLRRWNRGHASPQLFAATPSDYFAALEQLHDAGHVQPQSTA